MEVALDVLEEQWACEQVALPEVALLVLEDLELGLVLDSLSEGFQAECLAELDQCVRERA